MATQTKKVPRLRFPEFSNEWEVKKLGDIGKFIGGGTPSKKVRKYWVGDIPWVSSSDVLEDDIRGISYTRFITKEAMSNSATKLIPANSILAVSRVGVGKLAINDKDVCTSQDFTNIVLHYDNTTFVTHLLKSKKSTLLSFNQGTSIKGFTTNDLATLHISIPLKGEQRKIAGFLEVVDDRISALQKKKGLLQKYKKGIMQATFSQEIRFKGENGKTYPDWVEKTFQDCLETVTSKPHQIQSSQFEASGKYPVVDQGQEKIAGYSNASTKVFSKVPVIIFGDHTTFLKYVDYNFIVGADGTKILRTKTQNLKYLFYFLENNHLNPEGYKRHFGILKILKLKIPIYKEQKKIAEFLTSIDEKIDLTERELEQTKQFKKALLQQMFV